MLNTFSAAQILKAELGMPIEQTIYPLKKLKMLTIFLTVTAPYFHLFLLRQI